MILDLDQDYIPFGLRNNRKGDWKRENTFWNYLGQPTYTGRVRYATRRVRYEWDYKTRCTPLAQIDLSSSKPTSRRPSSSPRATIDFTKKREGGRLHWRRLGSRIEGPWIWISHRSLFSPLKVP